MRWRESTNWLEQQAAHQAAFHREALRQEALRHQHQQFFQHMHESESSSVEVQQIGERQDTRHAFEHDEEQRKKELQLRSERRNVRFLLIRHAESEANLLRKGQIGGRQNSVGLTEKGAEQAAILGKRLRNMQLDAVYSSVAERARTTARIACREMGIPEENIQESEAIVELSQGEWERKNRAEVYTPQVLARMNADNWEHAAPGVSCVDGAQGESQCDVESRMIGFLEEIISTAGPDTEAAEMQDVPVDARVASAAYHTVAVFTHGMAIKCCLRGLEQSSPAGTHKRMVDNTSITEVLYSTKDGGSGGWFIKRVNDVAHLDG